MTFDNAEVKPGDGVYDVAYGQGVVTRIKEQEQRFDVVFGERQYSYDRGGIGYFRGRKTLFWRDPIERFIPSRDNATWDTFTKIRDAVAIILGQG